MALDLAKAAKLLAEVHAADADADVDLSGLTLVTADEDFLTNAGQLIRSQAQVCAAHAVSLALCSVSVSFLLCRQPWSTMHSLHSCGRVQIG